MMMINYLIATFICIYYSISFDISEADCVLGKNYDFEGERCIVAGDPHFTMFSEGKHNFMGDLAKKTGDGKYKDSFYYVARCERQKTVKEMPFQIVGTHYYGLKSHFGVNTKEVRTATVLDYVTIQFIGTDNREYYLFFNNKITAYVRSTCTGASINYDETVANTKGSSLKSISREGATNIGGFVFTFHENWMTMKVRYMGGKTADVRIHMSGHNYPQWVPKERDVSRKRQYQNFMVELPAAFKCHSCGLCGQFTKPGRGNYKQMMKECDGHWLPVRSGIYDPDAWTFEYNFFKNKCGKERHSDLLSDVDPDNDGHSYRCPKWKETEASQACDANFDTDQVKEACDLIEGCQQFKDDCKFDACFGPDSHGAVQKAAKDAAEDVVEESGLKDLVEIAHLKDASKSVFKASMKKTGLENPNNPQANTYSIIGNIGKNLRSYRNDEGLFKFRLVYKYKNGAPSRLEWVQRSWITEKVKKIDGFKSIEGIADYQKGCKKGYCFKGLARSDSPNTYLDGNGKTKYYWNSVGLTKIYKGGIPGFNGKVAKSFKLYIEKQEGGGGGYGYAAKGDVIDVDDQQINDDEQVDDIFDDGNDDDMFYDEEQVNYDDDAQYIDDDEDMDDVQFDDEPQNEEYGAYDIDNDDYEQQPKYMPYYVPLQQPVAPSIFTLDNIFLALLIIMVITMTISITLCCMNRSSRSTTKHCTHSFNDEHVKFVN